VSFVGLDDCDDIALMGQNNVESTARPRKRILPQTFCMNFFSVLSNNGAFKDSVAYCFLARYIIRADGNGASC
jgi:hypothetical protein